MATVLTTPRETTIPDPPLARFLFSDARMAPVWAVVRVYVGWQFLAAGWEKLTGAGWVGADAGKSMAGFAAGAIKAAGAAHPSVTPYYAWFLQHFVVPAPAAWGYAITFGELLVGLGLIVGLFTGVAAFFAGLMNVNYLLAGTLGTMAVNPPLFVLATGLVLAWKVAGLIGLDYFALRLIGVPGAPGKLLRRPTSTAKARARASAV